MIFLCSCMGTTLDALAICTQWNPSFELALLFVVGQDLYGCRAKATGKVSWLDR